MAFNPLVVVIPNTVRHIDCIHLVAAFIADLVVAFIAAAHILALVVPSFIVVVDNPLAIVTTYPLVTKHNPLAIVITCPSWAAVHSPFVVITYHPSSAIAYHPSLVVAFHPSWVITFPLVIDHNPLAIAYLPSPSLSVNAKHCATAYPSCPCLLPSSFKEPFKLRGCSIHHPLDLIEHSTKLELEPFAATSIPFQLLIALVMLATIITTTTPMHFEHLPMIRLIAITIQVVTFQTILSVT